MDLQCAGDAWQRLLGHLDDLRPVPKTQRPKPWHRHDLVRQCQPLRHRQLIVRGRRRVSFGFGGAHDPLNLRHSSPFVNPPPLSTMPRPLLLPLPPTRRRRNLGRGRPTLLCSASSPIAGRTSCGRGAPTPRGMRGETGKTGCGHPAHSQPNKAVISVRMNSRQRQRHRRTERRADAKTNPNTNYSG